ncbi:uncharacterized protein LOC144752500 [Lissotriton helveticus]
MVVGSRTQNTGPPPPIRLHNIYNPPGNHYPFIDELSNLLTQSSISKSKNIFLGDFNLHWNDTKDPSISLLSDLLEINDLKQICQSPTHSKGATLEAIITSKDLALLSNIIPIDWSDHHLILFTITASASPPPPLLPKLLNSIRNLSLIPPDLLESKLHAPLLAIPPSLNTNELTEQYNKAVTATLDLLAPLKLKKQRNIPSKSWFNTDLNNERRRLRLTERLWRQHPSPSNLTRLRLARSSYKHIFRQKTSFFRSQLDRAQNRPRELFNIVRNQTTSAPPVPLASTTRCEEIALFFSDKIKLIEQSFLSTVIPPTNPNISLNIPPSTITPPTPITAHQNSDLPHPPLPSNFL